MYMISTDCVSMVIAELTPQLLDAKIAQLTEGDGDGDGWNEKVKCIALFSTVVGRIGFEDSNFCRVVPCHFSRNHAH